MKIGIDARICSYNRSGISRYLLGLLNGLIETDTTASDKIILFQNWRERQALASHPKVSKRTLFTPPHHSFEKTFLGLELRKKEVDLLHCIDFFAPIKNKFPLIFTAQDLYFLRNPASMTKHSFKHYSKFKDWVSRADHVVCSSQSTLDDLLSLTALSRDKGSVVYPGLDTSKLTGRAERITDVRNRYGISAAPLIYLGTLEPRKNLERTLEAYEIAHERRKGDIPPFLLVGRSGYQSKNILSRIKKCESTLPVKYLGEIPDQDLFPLLKISHAILYPSLYEGFGFPILEGWASHVPVLTSNCSSMNEVGGDAVCLVDPESSESTAMGILKIVEDNEYRKALVEKGVGRLTLFSWNESANKLRSIYQKCGAQA